MNGSQRKVVIVTGASKGIGNSIAAHLASRGYAVHGVYNTSKEAADMLAAKYEVIFHQADLLDRRQTLKLAHELSTLSPYALINDAGVWQMDPPDDTTFSVWDKTLEVNLTAPLILSRILSKSMPTGGSIVNITSTDGLVGAYNGISYSASKAALINLTKSLGNSLGPKGLRVNAIAPGWIDTGMVEVDVHQYATDTNPIGRIGKTDDIANLVEFLISDKAGYINGETIVVDGGGVNVDYGLKKESGY